MVVMGGAPQGVKHVVLAKGGNDLVPAFLCGSGYQKPVEQAQRTALRRLVGALDLLNDGEVWHATLARDEVKATRAAMDVSALPHWSAGGCTQVTPWVAATHDCPCEQRTQRGSEARSGSLGQGHSWSRPVASHSG